jgi:hypothetical protein
VRRYVADPVSNGGPQEVLGALAVELAECVAEAPPYARARVAAELRACVLALKEAAKEQTLAEAKEEWLNERRAWRR